MQAATEELKAIGIKLAELRTKRGFSQNQLSAASGIAQGTISNMEQGADFKVTSLLSLLIILDVSLGDFFSEAGFTDAKYWQKLTFTITVDARGYKNATGTVAKG